VSELPCLSFFPALRLARNVDLGAWIVGAPPADAAWRSQRFRALGTKLLDSFDDIGFTSPAIVWSPDSGLDGTPPRDAAKALEAAIRFATLDANDQVDREHNAGHFLATSENCALYIQPIDEDQGSVAHVTGGMLRSGLVGGWKIGDRPLPLPDAVMPIQRPVRVSQKLARAVFDVVADATTDAKRRISIAIEWHSAAMANPRAVTLQHRLISLKTGFEALLGTSKSAKCAERLRDLFQAVTKQHAALLPWSGCIWSPNERTNLPRQYKDGKGQLQQCVRSEVEDWFMALADVRNAIIHEGRIIFEEYQAPPERPLSRYAGHLFWIGERILREAIKASLGAEILLCGLLAERKRREECAALLGDYLLREVSTIPASGDAEAPTPSAPVRVRAIPVLLAELRCDAANKVLLYQNVGGWVAKTPSIEMTIEAAEADLLRQSGAEDELPSYFDACD